MKRLAISLCLIAAPLVSAEEITFYCSYDNYSDQEGNHKLEENLQIRFTYNKDTGKSYMLGNIGRSEVELFRTNNKATFIEITTIGNVTTTTIDNNLNSVHSRNTVMFGEIEPSQYYGKCKVK